MLARGLRTLGWIFGTQLRVFLACLVVGLAVGMPVWWSTGDVRLVMMCAFVAGAFGAGVWYIRYFPRVRDRLDKLRADDAQP